MRIRVLLLIASILAIIMVSSAVTADDTLGDKIPDDPNVIEQNWPDDPPESMEQNWPDGEGESPEG